MATILDAFLVTIGMDAKDLKKGAEDAEKVYEDLVKATKAAAKATIAAAKGKSAGEIAAARESAKEVQAAALKAAKKIRATMIQEAKETTEKIKEQAEKGKEFFKGLTEAGLEFFGIMAMGIGMVEFAKSTLEAEVNAGRLAKTLNVDVTELEALEGAVKTVGGTTEGMDASLKGLNSRLEMIAIHGPRSKMALQIFAGLGISAVALKGKDATQVLGLLAEKMHGMSEAKAMGLGERLGLDEGTIRLLVKGKEGMAELTEEVKKMGVPTKEEVAQADKLHHSMLHLQTIGGSLGRQLMSFLMPALEAIATGLQKLAAWAKEHPEAIKAAILGIGGAFLALKAQAISAGIAAFGAWVKAQAGALIAGAQFLITGAQAAIAWAMATGGLYLLIPLIVGVVAGLIAMTGHVKDVGHWFNEIALDIVYWMALGFFKVEHAAARMWDSMKKPAGAFIQWLEDKIFRIAKFFGMGDKALKIIGEVNGKIKESQIFFKSSTAGHQLAYAGAHAGVHAGMSMRPSSISNNHATSTSHRETHIGQITVQTQATDAQGIAAGIGGALKSHSLFDINQADGGMA